MGDTKTMKVSDIAFPVRPRIWPEPWMDGYAFSLVGYDIPANGDYREAKRYVVTEVALTEFQSNEILPGTTLNIPKEEIQQLMDELWRAGVRPTEVGTAGQLQAVEDHAKYLEKTLDAILPSALRKPG